MPRPVLVLVDPNDGRRQRYGALLQRHFELYSFATTDLAFKSATTMRAGIVVAHMQQSHGDGLDLARELRQATKGWGCLIVVHGSPQQDEHQERACLSVMVNHQADLLLAQEVSPAFLLKSIARRVKGFELREDDGAVEYESAPHQVVRRRRLALPRMPSSVDVQIFFHRLDQHLTWPKVREALGRPRTALIEELPDPDAINWRQALIARASGHNLRVVLRMPVTPLVRRLPVDRPPSLREVLRAEVSRYNLRVLLETREVLWAA